MSIKAITKQKIHQYGLSNSLDRAKFWYYKQLNYPSNHAFKKVHPEVAIPPDYMLYEAYGLNYRSYYEGGQNTARWIADIFQTYIDLSHAKILDWGCGPARVTRHLASLLPDSLIFGTDYNKDTIRWCLEHIPDVRFQINGINPPLGYPPIFFDAIYGISIFTHLSDSNHDAWIKELCRRLKDCGLLLITTQGVAHITKLTHREQKVFRKGEIVVREGIKEGHLT